MGKELLLPTCLGVSKMSTSQGLGVFSFFYFYFLQRVGYWAFFFIIVNETTKLAYVVRLFIL